MKTYLNLPKFCKNGSVLLLLGNRAGRGYNPNQQVVVGGRSSVDIGEHKSSLRGRGSRHSNQGRGVSWAPDTMDKDFDRSVGKPLNSLFYVMHTLWPCCF